MIGWIVYLGGIGVRIDPLKKECHISVKDLVFFPVVSIGYSGSYPISRQSRAGQGRQLHEDFQERVLQLDKSAEMQVQNEKFVKMDISYGEWHFFISGRVDSVQISSKQIVVQEIKSVLDLKEFPAKLQSRLFEGYRRQLLIYCQYFRREFPKHKLIPQLVLMEIGSKTTQIIDIPFRSQKKFIEQQCEAILANFEESEKKKKILQSRESSIIFPFSDFRPHQEEMMEQISKALQSRRSVMLNAPTGLGKTVGSLIPALRHTIASNLRLFIVTSKTTQQRIYADTLRLISQQRGKFNAVILTAKEKMCINETYLCDPHFCPYISDYTEENVAPVVEQLLKHPVLQAPYLRKIARKKKLCPFELALDASLGCDVIVGDYNYVFNPQVRLQRYFDDTHDDCLILIDEAHNLPDRARDYYSPSILREEIAEVLKFVNSQPIIGEVKKEITAQIKEIRKYLKQMHTALEQYHDQRVVPVKVDVKKFTKWMKKFDQLVFTYVKALGQDEEYSLRPDDPLLAFIRGFTFFTRLLKEHTDLEYQLLYYPKESKLNIFCKSAHKKLKEQMKGFYAVIAQSATLTPVDYYRKMLGLPKDTLVLRYPSPFPPDNRLILNYNGLSTRYEHRENTYRQIAELITQSVSEHPGNYLAFFPSFAYLESVYHHLEILCRDLPVSLIKQGRNMLEKDRNKVLKLLKSGTTSSNRIQFFGRSVAKSKSPAEKVEGYLLCGVHRGIFSEGVDYEGDMGIGVFIVGPGLPSYNFEQELIKDYFDKTFQQGFEYAYRNPGITSVIQAAGRIFRSAEDKGTVLLIGERFSLPYYSDLLPKEWEVIKTGNVKEIIKKIKEFWSSQSH